MPIADTDIELRQSGGAAVTDPNLSLGGAMSTVAGGIITDNVKNNDMDDIKSSEGTPGITIYHGYYYKNNHGSLTYQSPKLWIEQQTLSGDTSLEIALADEDVSIAIETIPNETTAPVGPVFTSPANKAAGLSIGAIGDGNLDFSEYRGFWVKYVVNAAAVAFADQYQLKIEGDSPP